MNIIGFIGVGSMGRGMCENIIKNGYEVYVYDKNSEAASYFEGRAKIASSVKEIGSECDVIMMSLPNSNIVEAVVGELIKAGVEGKIIIDLSTSFPESTKMLYLNVKENKGDLVDAPLLGGPDSTMAGTAPCMVSGDKEIVDKIIRILSCFAQPIDYFGSIGNAHTIKLAMNFTGLMYAALAAQMFPLIEKEGINTKKLFKIMNDGPFGNRIFNFYGRKFVEKDYHFDFALELALKDMTYMKRMYDKYNVPGFLLDGGLELLKQAVEKGRGKNDTSEMALIVYEYFGLDTGEKKP